MAGPPFHAAIDDLVAFACQYLQAAGGEQNGDETQRYEQEWNWLFAATCGECREDRTVSCIWRSYLQKWQGLRFEKCSLILLL